MISPKKIHNRSTGLRKMENMEICNINIRIYKKNKKLLKAISKLKELDFNAFIGKLVDDLAEIYRNEIIFPF